MLEHASEEEREFFERTGVLHPDAMKRVYAAELERLRQFKAYRETRTESDDPTMQDNVHRRT